MSTPVRKIAPLAKVALAVAAIAAYAFPRVIVEPGQLSVTGFVVLISAVTALSFVPLAIVLRRAGARNIAGVPCATDQIDRRPRKVTIALGASYVALACVVLALCVTAPTRFVEEVCTPLVSDSSRETCEILRQRVITGPRQWLLSVAPLVLLANGALAWSRWRRTLLLNERPYDDGWSLYLHMMAMRHRLAIVAVSLMVPLVYAQIGKDSTRMSFDITCRDGLCFRSLEPTERIVTLGAAGWDAAVMLTWPVFAGSLLWWASAAITERRTWIEADRRVRGGQRTVVV